MKKSTLIVGVMLVLGTSTASAQGGVNLSWNDCGVAGLSNLTFACNSNSGAPFSAIASFFPPATMPEYLGLNSQVDVRTPGTPLPAWWHHGIIGCRGTTGLAISFDFTIGPFTCVDFFGGQAAGGFVYEYPSGPHPGERSRVRITCAVPFDNRGPIDAGVEYYAYKLNILRAKTTGTGSCAGCSTPACLALDNMQLYQPPEQNYDPIITNPASRSHVTWQSADPTCPQSTPAANKTWGQVKSLYR